MLCALDQSDRSLLASEVRLPKVRSQGQYPSTWMELRAIGKLTGAIMAFRRWRFTTCHASICGGWLLALACRMILNDQEAWARTSQRPDCWKVMFG